MLGVLYIFNRLMDEKQERLANSLLPLLVFLFTTFYLALYIAVQIECN